MKPRSDEELQRMLDQHDRAGIPDATDATVYRKLYEALGEAPHLPLSENFANQVVDQAFQLRRQRNYWQSAFVFAIVVLSLILSALAIYYTDAIFFRTLTQLILQTKEIIVFIIVTFTLVQLGDHWLVKKPK